MTHHNSAKSNILKSLREAQQKSVTPLVEIPDYNWQSIPSPLEHFTQLLEGNHAKVKTVNRASILKEIVALVDELQCSRQTLASDRAFAEIDGLEKIAGKIPEGNIEVWKDFIFNQVDIGITTADCAIAATGALVLCPGPDEPKTLSLVPPHHIVIVEQSGIYNDFAALLNAKQWNNGLSKYVLLVSGPSKTADIQQKLAYGAHGPKALYVFVVME